MNDLTARYIAAQNAEDAARRDEASAVLSGVALVMFLGMLVVWMGILGTSSRSVTRNAATVSSQGSK